MSAQDDLLKVFDQAVVAFDAWQIKPIADLLAKDAVVYGIGGGVKANGDDAVCSYLDGKLFPKKPAFHPLVKSPTITGDTATIQGLASWNDNDHDRDGFIQYAFGFRSMAGKWRITKLWGSRDS